MADNDQILLASLLEKLPNESSEGTDQFETFALEQVLKNYEISAEDLQFGIVDKGNDGGIDGFFTFINKELIKEETDPLLEDLKRNPRFEVFVIQIKEEDTFRETVFDRLRTTIEDLFELSNEIEHLTSIYNSQLLENAAIFRNTYKKVQDKFPSLKIHLVYISKGDTSSKHIKVDHKANSIKELIQSKFSTAAVELSFIGARELLELASKEKSYTRQLVLAQNFISVSQAGQDYVLVANLKDYFNFVCEPENGVLRYLFNSNVRDYEGNVEVNKEIRASLETNDPSIDFWWLNNGITILATNATSAGRVLTLENVQIVNGLQTTLEVCNYYIENPESLYSDNRSILIRVIVTDNPEIQDQVIKATNSQTNIRPASLRATDSIQRSIEQYFFTKGLYYDRRKNYYKNIGKPKDRIIGISTLAQAVASIIFREPHVARARPASIIKNDDDYKKIFNNTISLETYLSCAKLLASIDTYVKSIRKTDKFFSSDYLYNFKYIVAMILACKLTKKRDYKLVNLEAVINAPVPEAEIARAYYDIHEILHEYFSFNDLEALPPNTLAKQKHFTEWVLSSIPVEEGFQDS